MKVGINLLLWTAAADESHLNVLDQIKEWGYDGFELPMFDPACSPWKKLADHADGLGLGRTAVTIVSEEANPISEDKAIREKGIEHIKKCIDSCAELGAETLVGPMYSPCGKLVGRGRTGDEFQWAKDAMAQAAEYGKQANVVIAMEPLNRFETYVFNGMTDAVQLCEEVGHPNLGLLYDTFHCHIEEKDPAAAIQKAGKHIAHVHISESDRSTPGKGQVRWDDTFKAIKSTGYDGWLTIEAFGRSMPEVAAATCIWRSMFDSEEQLATDGLNHIKTMWSAA